MTNCKSKGAMKFNIHNVNKQCPGPTKGPALINIPPQPRGPGDETRDEREEPSDAGVSGAMLR